jgi:peptide/nickel transport system substrate-binding protein
MREEVAMGIRARRYLWTAFAGGFLIFLLSCGGKNNGSDDVKAFPRDKTLYLAGLQDHPPGSFNPLIDYPTWPAGQPNNLMYEPLLLYNTLTGKLDPLLARLYEYNNDYVSVIMNPAARWSDGVPLTAEDVKYTYEFGKRFGSAQISYVWDFISEITIEPIIDTAAHDGKSRLEKVTFHVDKKKENNPIAILDQLMLFQIIPKHIIEARLKELKYDLTEFQKDNFDRNPVVSGPYNLYSVSIEKIAVKRRDDYWGNKALYGDRKPTPEYIIHPIFKSSDHFSTALKKGSLDVNCNFSPRIWLKHAAGVRTWYAKEPYFVPGSIPMIVINVTKYPLSDINVRRAMAAAINYKDIRELAVSGYSPEIKPGLILPYGLEKRYYSEEDAQKYGTFFDPLRARKILADAGYTPVFDKHGNLEYTSNAKGERVPTMHIKCPAGWADFESIVKIAVKSLRAAGIDVREGFCDEGLFYECQYPGDFELLMDTPQSAQTPSMPFTRFEFLMTSRNWKPCGESMFKNWGRYNNPADKGFNPRVDELLRKIPILTDKEELKKAYRELNVIFMKDLPTIPLVYKPEEYYDFSITHWTNFATEDNPYAPPQLPCFGVGRNMLWELKQAK